MNTEPQVEVSARTGRLDKRCHRVEWGDEPFHEWYHAYAPSAADIAGLNTDDVRTIHALVDRLVLMGESSFAGEGYQSATEMPFDLFGEVLKSVITPGRLVRPDGACHR